VSVPVAFDAAVEAGEMPDVGLYLNPQRGWRERLAFRTLVEREMLSIAGEMPASLAVTDVGPPQANAGQATNRYFAILWAVLGLVMSGLIVAPLLMVEEKEKHTMQALRMSPASTAQITMGKALASFMYTSVIVALMMFINGGWIGDWPITLVALLLGLLLVIALGLLLGNALLTTVQVNTWASLTMFVLIFPSWLPALIPGGPADTVFRFIPTYYLVDAMNLALSGQGYTQRVWLDLTILLGCAAVAWGAVVWALRRAEARRGRVRRVSQAQPA
jgi:ABC-2 type transport system permease protein